MADVQLKKKINHTFVTQAASGKKKKKKRAIQFKIAFKLFGMCR